MKRLLTMSMGLAVLLAITLPLQAANPRGKTEITLNGKTVSIDYGRPGLHGRTIQQILAMKSETGNFWRLGADTSTTFVTGVPLVFGNKTVPAGTYSLWAEMLPQNKWELVFNTQHGQWGTSHNPKLDLVKVPLHETKTGKSVDLVTIKLVKHGMDTGHFSVQWGDLVLENSFKVK